MKISIPEGDLEIFQDLGSLGPEDLPKGWFSKGVVLADVPPERKPERGYIRIFPQNENSSGASWGAPDGVATLRVRKGAFEEHLEK